MQVDSLHNVVKIMKHIKLKIAAATPEQYPHVIVPWTDEHAYLVTSTVILRGRHGNLRLTWQAWHLLHWASSGGALGQAWSPALCVAGVALGEHLASQAWNLVTSTVILRGRHGRRHLPTSTFLSRSRRATYSTGLALVARLGELGCR